MSLKAHAGPEAPLDQELGIANHPKCDHPMQSILPINIMLITN